MTPAAGRCHVCGRALADLWATATDTEYGTTAERFAYFHCAGCDALSIAPLPAGRLDEIYPPTYYSFATGAGALESRHNLVTRVKAALDRRGFARALELAGAPAAPRVLDVGGGSGDIAAGLVESTGGAARATVVDLDERSVKAARARGLDAFHGRFEDFEAAYRFDLVLMLNLVEHVADPAAVLVKARALLEPGGVVWLQTPNFRSLDARLFRRRNWAGLHCPRHWVVFSEAGLRKALADAGLEPVAQERTQAGAFWAASLLGLGRARAGRASVPAGAAGVPGGAAAMSAAAAAAPPAAGLPRPLVASPAFMPLAALGAAFDFATRPVRPTSQVVAFARARS